ncbi:hypothetical protein FOL47_007885 [Perkinsus chesapeaki]|uniref:Glucosylceramidase n=1 Tax=Perkinsus chesapeaki TaxID=330153 RepID=A0A7J6LHN5_PERCH|nr:hypothetical protein FOL47_007885 [Perkinsus chesapeaki]
MATASNAPQLPTALPSGNLDELKKLVIATLEKNGALGDLRAQLRSCVYKAIESDDYMNEKNPGAKLLSDNPNGALVAELVAEFLEFYHLSHSLRIYVPELNLPRFRLSRRELEQECGLTVQTDPSQSLLQHLVAVALNTPASCGSPIGESPPQRSSPGAKVNLSQVPSPGAPPYRPLITKSPSVSPDRGQPIQSKSPEAAVPTPRGGHLSVDYAPRNHPVSIGGELPASLQETQGLSDPREALGSFNVLGDGSAHADSLLSTDGPSSRHPRAPPPSTTDGEEISVTSSTSALLSPLGRLGTSSRGGKSTPKPFFHGITPGLSAPHWSEDIGVDRSMSSEGSGGGSGGSPSITEGLGSSGTRLLGELPPLRPRPGARGSPVKLSGIADSVPRSPDPRDSSNIDGPSAVDESLEENVLRLARLTDEIQSLMRKPASISSPVSQSHHPLDSGPSQGDSAGKDSPRYEEDWAQSSASGSNSSHRSAIDGNYRSAEGGGESSSRDSSSMPSLGEESQDSSGQLDALCEYIEDVLLTLLLGFISFLFDGCSSNSSGGSTTTAAPPPPQGAAQTYTTTETGEPLQRAEVRWNDAEGHAATTTVALDPGSKHQKIQGFGATFTQAAAYLYKNLNRSMQEQFMRLVFGPDGLHYNLGRVPINSCDFSPDTYNFDNVSDDFNLEHFDSDLKKDEEHGMFSMIHDAQSYTRDTGGLSLLASPWSPPYWMKNGNHEMIGSEMPCLKNDTRYHRAWAEYRSLWFQGYAKHGINFTYHTVQNEPGNYINIWWEQCFYDAKGEADFVANHLGPVMERDGHEVSLLFYDFNKMGMMLWADEFLQNEKAASYVSGIALHWYDGPYFENVKAFQEKYGDKYYQLATEGCNCDGVLDVQFNTEWKRAMRYAEDILGDLNSNVVGWMDWSILLNIVENGAGGPNHSRLKNWCYTHIHVTNSSELTLYRSFYTFSHISRFVTPGYQRIDVSVNGNTEHLTCSAFLSPDESKIVLVATNYHIEEQTEEKHVDISLAGRSGSLHVVIPSSSIVTVEVSL